jgi:hypothetical protein
MDMFSLTFFLLFCLFAGLAGRLHSKSLNESDGHTNNKNRSVNKYPPGQPAAAATTTTTTYETMKFFEFRGIYEQS